ncbi:hydroxyproline-rich glycoprotein family protein [Parasponia andersonii]|uniref:Hydroxyproline-rich glycoprotein family protein n=1 Tax=Parasponia andersonii TaxID=3476 RepID=A0A2P5B3K8_PARAD|nr:hydroxyproline-rich glycoprotein family protein [Parasponia andersonii]
MARHSSSSSSSSPSSSSSSSSEDISNKKEEHVQPQSTEPNPPLPPPPPQPQYPPVVPTPQMGYPPAMGYPPPYTNNPPNGQPHPYNPYTQPLPAHYYPNHPYTPAGASGGSAFVRGFLATLIILIIFICLSSIITWLILRPQIPVFHVDSFVVSNLNLSKADFAATWEANVTAQNPNHKLKIYFDQIQSFVYYKENFLSSSAVDPLLLETETRDVMRVRLATNNTVDHLVGNWVVDEIARERNAGVLSFNLRMVVFATFKSGAWWTRHASMKVFCENLKVNFVGAENKGVLDSEKDSGDCDVYYG